MARNFTFLVLMLFGTLSFWLNVISLEMIKDEDDELRQISGNSSWVENPLSPLSPLFLNTTLPETVFGSWPGLRTCTPRIPTHVGPGNYSSIVSLTGPSPDYRGRAYMRLNTITGYYELYVVHNIPPFDETVPLEEQEGSPTSTAIGLDFVPNYYSDAERDREDREIRQTPRRSRPVLGGRWPPCRCCRCARGIRDVPEFVHHLNGSQYYQRQDATNGLIYSLHVSTTYALDRGGVNCILSLLSGCSVVSVSTISDPFGWVTGNILWKKEPSTLPPPPSTCRCRDLPHYGGDCTCSFSCQPTACATPSCNKPFTNNQNGTCSYPCSYC